MSKGLVYLILMMNNFKTILGCILFLCFFYNILYLFYLIDSDNEKKEGNEEKHNKNIYLYLKKSIIYLIIFILSMGFIPSTKQAAVIYIVPKITNNKEISELPSNILKLFNEEIKDLIEKGDN